MNRIVLAEWNWGRLLQLVFGLFCLGDFLFFSQEYAVLLLGGIFLFQAITNFQLGCFAGYCQHKPGRYE